ncbi:MAG: InlB B-repeat-containing protein [Bacilli bacterium]|nr:InlB B-repeat-containing protein [Bacilli bacterium]
MKKIFLILLSFFFYLFLLIPTVYAEEISFSEVTIKDKSGTITVDDIEFNNNTISSNITFRQLNDFVTLDVLVKNNDNTPFALESVSLNHNDYLSVEFEYGKIVRDHYYEHFFITLKYDKELINQEEVHLDNLKLNMSFSNDNALINPETKSPLLFIGFCLGMFFVLLLVIKKKKKLLLLLLFIPFFVRASEGRSISLEFSDITIKGRFLEYNVLIDYGNGDVETVVVTYGDKIEELPIPEKDGYDFINWINKETEDDLSLEDTVQEDIEIIPKFEPITYQLMYMLDGGTLSQNNPETYNIESESFTLNNPEKVGYSFSGWTEEDSEELQTSVTVFTGSMGNKVYTAHFSPNQNTTYTVIHQKQNIDGNGYTTEETQQLTGTTDTEVTPQRMSYTGFTAPVGQTKTINGDGSTVFTYQYTRNKYTFNISDRTYVTGTSNGSYYYGSNISVTAQSRAGYTFKWSDGTTSLTKSFTISGNTTLSAIYTANTNTPYKVIHQQQNLNDNNYTTVATNNFTGTTGTTVTPAVNTYTGFTSPSTQTKTILGDGSLTITYQYTRNSYTLTLTDSEYITTTTPSGTYKYGKSITLTANTRDGYTFTGWSDGNTNSTYTFTLTGNKTIGPNYEQTRVTITFNPNGGEVTPTSKEIDSNDEIGDLPIPVREEYTFVGWYTNLTGGVKVEATTTFNSTTSIYARWEEIPILYNVLKHETEDGGLARKYEGEHKDSFTEEASHDIYHWYAENDTQGTEVTNKNNVIFGNHCWKILRTTDTGGVKLWYNGETENNQCLETRQRHPGYSNREYLSLNSSYWYGTDYTYDVSTKKFSVSGLTEQVTWNATTGPSLVGKYTCKGTSETSTCDKIYLIHTYASASGGYALSISSNESYSIYGNLPYSPSANSIAYVGYKYGTVYPVNKKMMYNTTHANKYYTLLNSLTFNANYWYADSISYDSSTNKYSLNNPYQVDNNSDLSGKYTLNQSNQFASTSNAYYIVTVDGTKIIEKTLSSGYDYNYYNPVGVGETIVDNENGTYTISDVEYRNLSDWYWDNKNSNDNYKRLYVCNYYTDTCSDPKVSIYPTSTTYSYTSVNNKIVVAKRHDGLQLLDTKIVGGDDMYFRTEELSDYKYTCGTTSDVCTPTNLKRIVKFSGGYYEYIINHYYGSDVTWDGTQYTLVDPIDFDNYFDDQKMNTHHYFCISEGVTTCTSVGFFVRIDKEQSYLYTFYITLSNGKKFEDAMREMLEDNSTDSVIKFGVDNWYKKYMLNYSEYLEDTIFCNNRVIDIENNGWDKNGNLNLDYSNFSARTVTGDLSCEKETDQFSVSNNKAKLIYPVGLLTSNEVYLFNNNNARKIDYPWLITPSLYNADNHVDNYAYNQTVYGSGSIASFAFISGGNYTGMGVVPVISLVSDIRYSAGDGSLTTPYYIGNMYNIDIDSSSFVVKEKSPSGWEVKIENNHNYIITSFKLNGTLIEGDTFIMPEENVHITDIQYVNEYYSITISDADISVPSRGRVGSTISLESNNFRVTSFKLNGTLIEGDSFEMPLEDVVITDIQKIAIVIVESAHNPYANSINNVVYYENTFEDATSLTVELTYQTESTTYDWIYLYDTLGSTTPYGNKKYGGSTLRTETLTINSNYLKIVFKTDGSVNNYYGFKAVIIPNY